jgi:hypothetical protein
MVIEARRENASTEFRKGRFNLALTLGVRVGHKIQVGEHMVEVKKVHSTTLMTLTIDGESDVQVSDQSRKEIVPSVHVFTGSKEGETGYRLAFEAPKSVKISRLN